MADYLCLCLAVLQTLYFLHIEAVDIGDVRLLGGGSPSEGRVEFYFAIGKEQTGPQWTRVCGEHWTRGTAEVVCRQLGYDGVINIRRLPQYGNGNGTLFVKIERCPPGTSRLLPRCRIKEVGARCRHNRDAGVKCMTNVAISPAHSNQRDTMTPFPRMIYTMIPATTSKTLRYSTAETSSTSRLITKSVTVGSEDIMTMNSTDGESFNSDGITTSAQNQRTGGAKIGAISGGVAFLVLFLLVSVALITFYLYRRSKRRSLTEGMAVTTGPRQLADGDDQYTAIAPAVNGQTSASPQTEVGVDEGFYTLPGNSNQSPYQELRVKSNTFAGLQKLKQRPPQQSRELALSPQTDTSDKHREKMKKPMRNNGAHDKDITATTEHTYDLPESTKTNGRSNNGEKQAAIYANDVQLQTMTSLRALDISEDEGTGTDYVNAINVGSVIVDEESPYENEHIGLDSHTYDDDDDYMYHAISRKVTLPV